MTMLDVAIAVVVVAGLVALYWAVAGGADVHWDCKIVQLGAELRDGAGVVDAKRRVVDYARSDGDVEVEE